MEKTYGIDIKNPGCYVNGKFMYSPDGIFEKNGQIFLVELKAPSFRKVDNLIDFYFHQPNLGSMVINNTLGKKVIDKIFFSAIKVSFYNSYGRKINTRNFKYVQPRRKPKYSGLIVLKKKIY